MKSGHLQKYTFNFEHFVKRFDSRSYTVYLKVINL